MAATNDERIKVWLDMLDTNEQKLHTEAVAQGYKDEVCDKCSMVLLAFHHFLRCDVEDCPKKIRNPDGSPAPSLLEQIFDPKPLT